MSERRVENTAARCGDVTPLVHVGYHKTGTTWLQREVFRRQDLGFAAPLQTQGHISQVLVHPHTYDFDAAAARATLLPAIRDVERRGLVSVLSSERLGGSPHAGGYDSWEIAGRIAEVFPAGRVLIVVREQRGMLVSTYKQYVRGGGSRTLADYANPPARGRGRVPAFAFEHFEYDRQVRRYQELFGAERVLVLAYEQLVADAQGFLQRLLEFCQIGLADDVRDRARYATRRNEGLSGLGVAVKRPLNRVFSQDRLNGAPLIRLRDADRRIARWVRRVETTASPELKAPFDRRLQACAEELVGDRYASSNARTAAISGVDLAAYGYVLPAGAPLERMEPAA